MKFIVDELPSEAYYCPFSRWEPYPPAIEEDGRYICTLCKHECNLSKQGCVHLKSVKDGETK